MTVSWISRIFILIISHLLILNLRVLLVGSCWSFIYIYFCFIFPHGILHYIIELFYVLWKLIFINNFLKFDWIKLIMMFVIFVVSHIWWDFIVWGWWWKYLHLLIIKIYFVFHFVPKTAGILLVLLNYAVL